MELVRLTQVRFIVSHPKVVSTAIADTIRNDLADRFPNASVDVMSSAALLASITFNELVPDHWTNAWMKREVQKIFEKYV